MAYFPDTSSLVAAFKVSRLHSTLQASGTCSSQPALASKILISRDAASLRTCLCC